MKKLISVLLALISAIGMAFALCGCQNFDNSLPHKEAVVYVDCTKSKARLSVANETEKFDLSGAAFFNKANGKLINNLVGGDRLEIYYTDESYEKIDHILVKKASAIRVFTAIVPGSGDSDVYSKKNGIVVNHIKHGVYWAIDKSGNCINLNKIDDATKLYATFAEEEVVETGDKVKTKLHYIYALYTYDPR